MNWLADVDAVFFDAVGTLIHPEPSPAAAYAEVARRHGCALTAEEVRPRFAAAFAREEAADLDNDYEGARAAGLRPVLFAPRGRAAGGVRHIGRLVELLAGGTT